MRTDPAARSARLGTWGLMIATAMQAADPLIVNVALPQIQEDLGTGIELGGAWVMTSYLCATAVMAPLSGWLRRRYGAGWLFQAAVGVYMAASLLCALAPSEAVIILFRVLQGAGAGIILPVAQAMLLDIHPEKRHGRILASWGAALMVGPIFGPLVGGVVTDLLSWRGVFAVNLPLGLLVTVLVQGLRRREEFVRSPPIDWIGIGLLMVGVAALQLSLERSVGRSWLQSPELIAGSLITVIAFSGLALRMRRSGFGAFRPDIFKDVNFVVAGFYNFMTSGLLFVTVVFIPALGQGALGYTATLAGFTIVPRAIFMMLVMLWVGKLIGKIDYRLLLGAGWLLMACGLKVLSSLTPEAPFYWIIIGSTVQAVGAGMLFTPHSTLAFSTLDSDLRTDAAGVYSLLRQLGFASGVALMSAVLRVQIDANLNDMHNMIGDLGGPLPPELQDSASLRAYSDCFRAMAVAALAMLPGIWLFRVRSLTRTVGREA
jgi:MFS transporter, DHA2 family, multidrug resistance protein